MVDRKLVALRAQASQTDGLIAALGEERVRQWWSTETFVCADTAHAQPVMGNLAACRMSTTPEGAGAALSVVGRGARDAAPSPSPTSRSGSRSGATLGRRTCPPLLAWSTSPLLVGGAAQLLAVQLLSAGASGSSSCWPH